MVKKFKIKDKHWGEKIWLIISTPEELIYHIQKLYKVNVSRPGSQGCSFEIGSKHFIWANSRDYQVGNISNDFMATVIHEVVHVVGNVSRKLGFKLEEASEEAYAYYTQFICFEIFEIFSEENRNNLKKVNKKRKKK